MRQKGGRDSAKIISKVGTRKRQKSLAGMRGNQQVQPGKMRKNSGWSLTNDVEDYFNILLVPNEHKLEKS